MPLRYGKDSAGRYVKAGKTGKKVRYSGTKRSRAAARGAARRRK